MNLGIDIDGVMTNFEAFGTEYAARWQYFHKMPIIYKPFYKLYYAFGFSRHPDTASMSTDEKNIFEQFYKEILYEYTQNCPVRSTWPEVLQSLKENGHQIFIVTKRYTAYSWLSNTEEKKQAVKDFLQKSNIIYDAIFFPDENSNKLEECVKHNLDILLDDDPSVLDEISSYKRITPICFHAGYNEYYRFKNRVRSPYEFKAFIDNL
jgi:uncharacterized HAD superfamily protein